MNTKYTTLGRLFMAGILAVSMTFFASCGSDAESAAQDTMNDAGDAAQEMVDEAADTMEEVADEAADTMEEVAEDMEGMDSIDADMNFAEGSVEASLNDFINNGTGTQSFVLDKVPFEGEEVSVEGKEQLDNVAAMLMAHPELKCEIQGHTTKAKNAVGATSKKAASGVRALWVKTKLSARGVEKDQLDSNGYGDEQLMEGVDPEDDSQKRLVLVMSK